MKKIASLIILISIAACSKKNENREVSKIDSSIIKLPDTAYVSENKDFLDNFKTVEDSVYIFNAPEDGTQPIRSARLLKPDYIKFYPKGMKIGNPRKPEAYALQKFMADRYTTCLIIQNPGSYSLTSINLIAYNNRAEAVSGFLELANKNEEKGFSSIKKSVLKRDSAKLRGLMYYGTEIKPVDANDPTRPFSTSEYFSISIKNGKIDTAKATTTEINEFKKFFR